MNCSRCGFHFPTSRLPFAVTILTVLVVVALFWCAGLTWQWENIRDQDSRRPQAQITHFSVGPYAVMKIYEDGWVAREAERMIEPVTPAKNGKVKK